MRREEVLTGQPLMGGRQIITIPDRGDLGVGVGQAMPRTLFMIPVQLSTECDPQAIVIHPEIWHSLCYSAFQLFQTMHVQETSNAA